MIDGKSHPSENQNDIEGIILLPQIYSENINYLRVRCGYKRH